MSNRRPNRNYGASLALASVVAVGSFASTVANADDDNVNFFYSATAAASGNKHGEKAVSTYCNLETGIPFQFTYSSRKTTVPAYAPADTKLVATLRSVSIFSMDDIFVNFTKDQAAKALNQLKPEERKNADYCIKKVTVRFPGF